MEKTGWTVSLAQWHITMEVRVQQLFAGGLLSWVMLQSACQTHSVLGDRCCFGHSNRKSDQCPPTPCMLLRLLLRALSLITPPCSFLPASPDILFCQRRLLLAVPAWESWRACFHSHSQTHQTVVTAAAWPYESRRTQRNETSFKTGSLSQS